MSDLHVICPECEFYFQINDDNPDREHVDLVFVLGGIGYYVAAACPSCESVFMVEHSGVPILDEVKWLANGAMVYHKSRSRPPLPPEVPLEYRKDYDEASAVLHLSPKASAALSRRALQHFLHTHRNIRGKNLYQEVQELLQSGHLPAYVSDVLDLVRIVGNAAAHPLRHAHTGEIIDVERGDAEWLLEVLEKVFNFYFVEPERARKRKAEIEQRMEQERKSSNK